MDTRTILAGARQLQTRTIGTGGVLSAPVETPTESVEWSTGPRLGEMRFAVKSPFANNASAGEQPTVAAPTTIDSTHLSEETKSTSRRIMSGVALALTGLGVVGGMVAMPQPAMAQTVSTTQAQQQATQTDNRVRNTTPVRVQNIGQVVDGFDKGNQIYVVGNPALNGTPLSQRDMARYQEVLQKYPNTYVVLVDKTTNVTGDDNLLSRGIGNNAEFQGVVNPQTGERDGVVFMIYHNVDGNPQARKIFMRSEAMLDRLGVGEEAFAAEDGTPGRLLNQFINAFKNEGKDIPGSLEVVMQTIQGAVDANVQQVVGGAQQAVQEANTALNGVRPKVGEFQRQYGEGGRLGSPDIQGWTNQLNRATEALQHHDFNTAKSLSGNVLSAIRAQETAMANYGQAPGIATQVREQLAQVQRQLGELQSNGHAESANTAYQQATRSLETFDTQYKAKDPAFMESLQNARTQARTAADEVAASKSSTETAKKVKIAIASTITLVILAVSIIANRRAAAAGDKARKELDAAIREIGDRSAQLMELLNTADVHDVAAYEGKTKELADALRENTVEALTMVGGAQKFIDEADKLVHAKGFGMVKNWFTTGQYNDAVALLTDPNRKISFSFSDSSRAVMEKGSKAESWREQLLKQGETREFQKSLKDVMLAMADNRDEAQKILSEIETKSSDINGYIQKVDTAAKKAKAQSEELQRQAADGLFGAPAVTGNLLPMVLADEKDGGLLARGRSLSARNFVSAWDDCTAPAERMSKNAQQVVDVGSKARRTLVPTIWKADAALNPQTVKTDWAHEQQKALSDRLNDHANKALRTDIRQDVETLAGDVEKLQTRVLTAVSQDIERREVSPGLMTAAEKDVDTARTEIHAELQGRGVFKKGTPDKVLREKDLDPTTRTTDAHTNHDAIKGRLDVGDVEKAAEHLKNIKDLTQDAHRLVKETRQALKDYTPTLTERNKRTGDIEASIAKTYQPSMGRIKSTYAPVVLKKVAPEVNAGDTLGDNIDQSLALIETARKQTASAETNFDRAALLTSRDDLTATDKSLKDSQAQLDGITRAEQILADRQKKAESDLSGLEGRYSQTRGRSNDHYVRNQAKSLMHQGEGNLQAAQSSVKAQQKDPYAADDSIKVAENVRSQVETAIAADKRAFDAASSAINSAQGSVASASVAIASAQSQSWHWSNSFGTASESVSASDLVGAYAAVASAQATIGRAQSQLRSQDYEAASSTANNASSQCSTAVAAAAAAVSSARNRFESQKRRLENLAEEARRREEERRAEEARRQASSSGSRGGSSGGGGGSGSRGGSF